MNPQQERIDEHCQSLKLEGLMQRYVALASALPFQAAQTGWPCAVGNGAAVTCAASRDRSSIPHRT